ncbi:DUF3994 domain-containing protein [Bacillus sp. BP-3]|uniref:DUF3994 domain-containing protein n=1 Tax=Bacillus sp. BP-3 TaxID=3022773 RepID=UPI00232D0B89|nr:DUF3994 domain-containing protein [Bacillus sp. BP-3]MDC2863587.1 DUF3994 domain-containing protein [Bacillus sp. BP-3]
MKAKKLVTLALPIMLLGGCATTEKSSKEVKTEESKTSKVKAESDVKKVRVLAEDYPQYLIDLGSEFDSEFKTLTTRLDNSLKGSATKEDILSSIDSVNKVIAKFEAIDPPNKYINSQKDIEKAIVKYKKALSVLKDGYTRDKSNSNDKRTDKEIVEQAETLLHEGDVYWIAVYQDMKNEITKSQGGGLESQELKGVTTGSGVDYDNVKKNVKDGTEIIANWGIMRDGKFNPLFILKGGSPKTFEIYTAGDYPNKTNYAEGTWEYDKSNMVLKMHITKQFANGLEAEVMQKDVEYKVQNYDTKNLQLYNEKAKTTTRYVKQK